MKASWVTHVRSGSAIVTGAALVGACVWGIGMWMTGWQQTGSDPVGAMRAAVVTAGPWVFWLCALAVASSAAAWGPRGMTGLFLGAFTLALSALTDLGTRQLAGTEAGAGGAAAAASIVAPMALMVLVGLAALSVLFPLVGVLVTQAGVARWHTDTDEPVEQAG